MTRVCSIFSQILSLFGLLEGFNVCACSVPSDNPAGFIAVRLHANEKPSIDSVMTSKPDFAFSRSVTAEQLPAFLESVFAIFRMKRGLIAPAYGFGGRQASVVVPLLVEKFHRSIGLCAPSQRWDPIDNTPEAALGAVQFVGDLHGAFSGFTASQKFRAFNADVQPTSIGSRPGS